MAQQDSFLKLKGRIGDLTFYKTKNGHQVREKGGVSAQRIATDPKYQRTRENNADFATASLAAKHLRDALRPLILMTYDPRMPNRLGSRMLRVVRADAEHVRGERQVLPQHLAILRRFNFNAAATLSNTLFASVSAVVDAVAGTVQVTVPGIQPATKLAKPLEATHFQFVAGAATLDFSEEGESTLSMAQSAELDVKQLTTEESTLALPLPADAGLPIVVVFGVTFYIADGGRSYGLNNGAYNPMAIINITV
ncbi:hypothetical protein [Parapedobacter tibetensis]|uniref:hypothetical protein n=1 Tax=Parapedobacter tibetensis TaxID=2972951 RepID=UPI00214DD5C8|nr:hypothetical protein [Parapedobacter tibetensis]